MSEVVFIIGLPGSGKTTYIHNVLSQDKSLVIFDDWGRKKWGNYFGPDPKGDFIEDDRYKDLIKKIKSIKGKIIQGHLQYV